MVSQNIDPQKDLCGSICRPNRKHFDSRGRQRLNGPGFQAGVARGDLIGRVRTGTLMKFHRIVFLAAGAAMILGLAGCEGLDTLPTTEVLKESESLQSSYRIGSDDSLQVFVWRQQELSTVVSVRPDGRITIPLIEDLEATGKTPTELARDIEKALSVYIQDPIVTVMVRGFVGQYQDRVRIVGEAQRPQALPYRSTMTLLDVMIGVGGITDFAAGNRATLTRIADGEQKTYRLFLDDLLRNGDLSANVRIMPGDVIVIPEAWF
jgi:polysaccharide export outer membrane protein